MSQKFIVNLSNSLNFSSINYKELEEKLKKRAKEIPLSVKYPFDFNIVIRKIWYETVTMKDFLRVMTDSQYSYIIPRVYEYSGMNLSDDDPVPDIYPEMIEKYIYVKWGYFLRASKTTHAIAYLILKGDQEAYSFLKNQNVEGIIKFFNDLEAETRDYRKKVIANIQIHLNS